MAAFITTITMVITAAAIRITVMALIIGHIATTTTVTITTTPIIAITGATAIAITLITVAITAVIEFDPEPTTKVVRVAV